MTSESPVQASPRIVVPAATVIVFRRGVVGGAPQLIMLERAAHMRFAAGASVFPGGRIDPPDRALAHELAPHLDPEDGAARIAAVRETLEETGLLLGVNQTVTAEIAAAARTRLFEQGALGPVLAEFGLTLDLDRLVPFARWCPPFERAFDTRFYLADVGTGDVSIAADGSETTRLYWSTAAETLRMVEQGIVAAIFPTLCNLERLAEFASFAEACDQARVIEPRLIVPWIEEADGVRWHCIPEGHGYPVCRHRIDDPARQTGA